MISYDIDFFFFVNSGIKYETRNSNKSFNYENFGK